MTSIGPSYRFIELTQNFEAIVDLEDYPILPQLLWHVGVDKSGYVYAKHSLAGKMHRFIMGKVPKGYIVDHINGNTLDNRKDNLRVITQRQNSYNSKKEKNSFSGIKGVIPRRKNGKNLSTWRAYIGYNYKMIQLGSFKTFEEAVAAREKAERELFGEFTRQ